MFAHGSFVNLVCTLGDRFQNQSSLATCICTDIPVALLSGLVCIAFPSSSLSQRVGMGLQSKLRGGTCAQCRGDALHELDRQHARMEHFEQKNTGRHRRPPRWMTRAAVETQPSVASAGLALTMRSSRFISERSPFTWWEPKSTGGRSACASSESAPGEALLFATSFW